MPVRNSVNANVLLIGSLLILKVILASPTPTIPSSDSTSQSLEISPAEAALHDQRSVWNIVWSCVSTIIACCWVAVHPNMLKEDATRWQVTSHRLTHMVLMIIAPELIICWAIRQWVGARSLRKQYSQSGWTMSHGYFLQMGGFVLLEAPCSTPEIITAKSLERLVKEMKITLPIITEREIYDRSKNDDLSKGIAIGQTTWFLAQCIARKIQGLTTTKLEIVTVAFAALNVFIYYFWWGKPMDVQTPVKVVLNPSRGVECYRLMPYRVDTLSQSREIESMQKSNGDIFTQNPERSGAEQDRVCARICTFLKNLIRNPVTTLIVVPLMGITALFEQASAMLLTNTEMKRGTQQISTFYAVDAESEEQKFIILGSGALIGVLFGGIHCIGWDYDFPTPAELTIWRASSIIITAAAGLGVIVSSSLYLGEKLGRGNVASSIWGESLLWVGTIGFIPYAIARVLLVVEAFISLRDLPPDALLGVRWASFIPHFQ